MDIVGNQLERSQIQNMTQIKRCNFQNEIRNNFKQKILQKNRQIIQESQNSNQELNSNKSQDFLDLQNCRSQDQLFKLLNNKLQESIKQEDIQRLIDLLKQTNEIVCQDLSCLQNVFHSRLFDTLKKILQNFQQIEILKQTIKLLTNIFVQEFHHPLYKQVQSGIYYEVIKHFNSQDPDLLYYSIQCVCNIFSDQQVLKNDYQNKNKEMINKLITSYKNKQHVDPDEKQVYMKFFVIVLTQVTDKDHRCLLNFVDQMEQEMHQLMVNDYLATQLLQCNCYIQCLNQLILQLYQDLIQHTIMDQQPLLSQLCSQTQWRRYLAINLDTSLQDDKRVLTLVLSILTNLFLLGDHITLQLTQELQLLDRIYSLLKDTCKARIVKQKCMEVITNIGASGAVEVVQSMLNHSLMQLLDNCAYQEDFQLKRQVIVFYRTCLQNNMIEGLSSILQQPNLFEFIYLLSEYQNAETHGEMLEVIYLLLNSTQNDQQLYIQVKQSMLDQQILFILTDLQRYNSGYSFKITNKAYNIIHTHFQDNLPTYDF